LLFGGLVSGCAGRDTGAWRCCGYGNDARQCC
jgi:hypothetical protein